MCFFWVTQKKRKTPDLREDEMNEKYGGGVIVVVGEKEEK